MFKLFKISKDLKSMDGDIETIKGHGMILTNKNVVVQWNGKINSVVMYDNFDDLLKISKNCNLKYGTISYKENRIKN